MIRTEDKQFEERILNDGSHIAVPFVLSMMQDGTRDYLVYSFCVKIAEEFEEKFGDEPLSEEAKAFLDEKITPIMEKLDFDCTGALDRIHMEFVGTAFDETRILPDCEIISTLDGEKWIDELELDTFELDPDDLVDRMAVIRWRGKIVCYCGLNDICDEDDSLELTVECAEDYRRQGFGSSCVAMLTQYLRGLGERVKYVCSVTNQNSFRTAAAAGLIPNREVLSFVCYRNEEPDGDEEEMKF